MRQAACRLWREAQKSNFSLAMFLNHTSCFQNYFWLFEVAWFTDILYSARLGLRRHQWTLIEAYKVADPGDGDASATWPTILQRPHTKLLIRHVRVLFSLEISLHRISRRLVLKLHIWLFGRHSSRCFKARTRSLSNLYIYMPIYAIKFADEG